MPHLDHHRQLVVSRHYPLNLSLQVEYRLVLFLQEIIHLGAHGTRAARFEVGTREHLVQLGLLGLKHLL